jgi:hypothetical protein
MRFAALLLLAVSAYAQTATFFTRAQLSGSVGLTDTTFNVANSSCTRAGYATPCATAFVPGMFLMTDNEIVHLCGVVGGTVTTALQLGNSSCPNIDGRGWDSTRITPHRSSVISSMAIEGAAAGIVSVSTYGAKCDGVTNDATTIQLALNSVPAGFTLSFPGSPCLINGTGTQLLLNSRCVSMAGTSLLVATGVGSSTDVMRVAGPCSGLVLTNYTVAAQSGTPAGWGLNLDATTGAIANFHIDHPMITGQFGSGGIRTTFPTGTDGIFDGVVDGFGVVRGGINLERAGDNLAFRDLNMPGTGPGFRVNLVNGAGNLLIDHNSISACSGSVYVIAAINPKVVNNILEPAAGCASPANNALIDFDGTVGFPIYMPITQNNQINDQPGAATYMIRDNYTIFAHHAFDQFNFGTSGQFGVLATVHSSNTKVLDPNYPLANPISILVDQSGTAAAEYMNLGLLKKGPNVQITSQDGVTPTNLSVQRTPGQSTAMFTLFDENNRPLLNFGQTGSIVFPYSLANSVLPALIVFDSGGNSRRVFYADPGADFISFGYQSPPVTGGGMDLWSCNVSACGARFRVHPSGGIAVGGANDPGIGQVAVQGLKTTGAAGGKSVVCVDTATGKLYASSTGTDCTN